MASSGALVAIDGSHGEGGGGIVRTALAMSALTQQSVKISSIRAGTPYPGLDVEDLAIARALARSCQAEAIGLETRSTTLVFHPTSPPQSLNGPLEISEGERLPNALVVVSTLLPVLARAGAFSSISCEGETYGGNALSYDYFAHVGLYACRKLGLYAFPEQLEAGFGRESRGRVLLDVEPSALTGASWKTRGRLLSCRATVATAGVPSSIGARGVAHLERLSKNSGVPILGEAVELKADRPGAFVTLSAQYESGAAGTACAGQKGARVESLVQQAFDQLMDWMQGDETTDPYLGDQLLVPAIFAEGETTFAPSRLTSRFLSSVWVAKQFLPIHITVHGREGAPGVVAIRRE